MNIINSTRRCEYGRWPKYFYVNRDLNLISEIRTPSPYMSVGDEGPCTNQHVA